MSDITVPSWRPQPEGGRRQIPWLAIAGGALALAAIAGAVLWGFSRSGPRVVPVVQAVAVVAVLVAAADQVG